MNELFTSLTISTGSLNPLIFALLGLVVMVILIKFLFISSMLLYVPYDKSKQTPKQKRKSAIAAMVFITIQIITVYVTWS